MNQSEYTQSSGNPNRKQYISMKEWNPKVLTIPKSIYSKEKVDLGAQKNTN